MSSHRMNDTTTFFGNIIMVVYYALTLIFTLYCIITGGLPSWLQGIGIVLIIFSSVYLYLFLHSYQNPRGDFYYPTMINQWKLKLLEDELNHTVTSLNQHTKDASIRQQNSEIREANKYYEEKIYMDGQKRVKATKKIPILPDPTPVARKAPLLLKRISKSENNAKNVVAGVVRATRKVGKDFEAIFEAMF